ncbi:nicotinate-nucleotide--dimethylbenzimidazole phosphoribosyltransferase [Streptomyces boncukensis]|uniref:Nicotinate-nucleotide--dimethylbenzimidazole phosphoribosyltransferase n=1 Tax=Streptomyces boncukensis TaxID=2711219 RepID=A0A6G4X3V2_9ACTN|nr:nicotinate-nucleotide--dimethylbenzimidazole phosphoribosyltransferase [Streptomyces boncukensis]NGO71527.1 nicotinate-nucleotide--dimethylbenzimidazole phosphoribosyltransferase [Streptomyces boncukensis]
MTDTGQVPGEGLPENAGGQPEGQQPGIPAPGGYTFADPADGLGGGPGAEEEDLLLMPPAPGAWNDAPGAPAQAPPAVAPQQSAAPSPAQGAPAHTPVPEPQTPQPVPPAPQAPQRPGRSAPEQQQGAAQGPQAAQPAPGPQQAPPGPPVQPGQPVPPGQPGGPVPPVQPVQPVQAVQPVQPVQAVQAGQAVHPAQGEEQQAPGFGPGQQLPEAPGAAVAPGGARSAEPGQETPAPAPGPHETEGRDSGSLDYGAVRTPQQEPGPPVPPGEPGQSAQPAPGGAAPRRPLHLGPPVPEQSGAVRSLSDRGPAGAAGQQPPQAQPQQPAAPAAASAPAPAQAAPVAPASPAVPAQEPQAQAQPQAPAQPQPPSQGQGQPHAETPAPGHPDQPSGQPSVPAQATSEPQTPVPSAPGPAVDRIPAQAGMPPAGPPVPQGTPPQPTPVRQQGPPTVGPEYLDVAHQDPEQLPGPQLGELPPQRDAWRAEEPQATSAETVGHSSDPSDPSGGEQTAAPVSEEAGKAPEAADGPAANGPIEVSPLGEAVTQGTEPEQRAEPQPDPQQAPAPAPAPAPVDGPTPGAGTGQEPQAQETPVEAVSAPAPTAAPGSGSGQQPETADEQAAAASAGPRPTAPEVEPAGPATPSISQGGPAAEAAPSTDGEPVAAAPAESPEPEPEIPEAEVPEAEVPEAEVPEAEGPEHGVPATEPAPGFADAEREAVHRLMRERRDIRNGFRSDPIPHEVLLRVLEAAHTAPSVGHSQPWDFVVIRSEETRRAMHELAQRQRDAYAKSLPKARAKQFRELKVEAILDTPVNIVVTADPTRGGRHTLGRHTQPQMAPYSSALAVENLWLAARAEGLGVGWVSFFDEREMVRALELPEHLEVVAYLCVGYVDEFPDEPELMQAGWSKRRPLSWVVHEESYGRRALPGAEPHDLLAETLDAIRPLDAKALGEAWERQKRMTKPAGALGMLEIISAQLCGLSRKCPPPVPEPAAVAIFAGDHGVHAQGVTPWPQEVTGQMVANFLGGGAVCNAFAAQVGAEVCVVDVGVASELPATPGLLPRKVRSGTADMTAGPALTRDEVARAMEVGVETARDLVAAGNKALLTGEMGIANTTASAALIAACTGADAAEVTGRGTGINDETHARKVDVVRRALELHQPDPADPIGLLAAFGGLEHAAMVGLILGGASLRTPVILDGVSAGAAALVARCLAPEALAACVAGHRSAEPGHVAALTKLGLRPLVDLDLRLGEGTGALLALPMVQSAARTMHEVATFDSAGVTEKG